MDLAQFADDHQPALSADEARHNLILSVLDRGLNDPACDVRFWPLGAPGACAVQQAGYGILLGDVNQAQAANLASDVRDLDIPSVVGSDLTALWFVEAAKAFGHDYPIFLPQTVQLLEGQPITPDVPGYLRSATQADVDMLYGWFTAFAREAVPHDKPPTKKAVQKRIGSGHVYLWCVDGRPAAMSCIARFLKKGVAIAPVYTPPAERCRGYAAAATAALVEHILKQDYAYVTLYTDDNNPASNRCYAKIGFRPYCPSRHYRRAR